jgi:hypothetical protein
MTGLRILSCEKALLPPWRETLKLVRCRKNRIGLEFFVLREIRKEKRIRSGRRWIPTTNGLWTPGSVSADVPNNLLHTY